MSKKRSARWGAAGLALALIAFGSSARLAPAQSPGSPSAGRIRQLLQVGDQIVGQNRSFGLGMFRQDPVALGQGVSLIHAVSDDGSVYMSDYAGASLLRFATQRAEGASTASVGSGQGETVLDTSRADPVDGVGLTRIVEVVVNRHGVGGVVALRADTSYGVYRLDKGVLTRLAWLPNSDYLPALAIGDADQIIYQDLNNVRLFRTSDGGLPVEILRSGDNSIAGNKLSAILGLASNAAGHLALKVTLRAPDGRWKDAILRKRGDTLEIVAQEGDTVELGRGAGITGPLYVYGEPQIGPDGTVAFKGGRLDDKHQLVDSNVFAQGPGRPLQPLLPRDTQGEDYAIDAKGTIAVRTWYSIYLVTTTGGADLIVDGQQSIQPTGRLAFDAHGDLFFLARNPDLPRDRYGQFPVRLYRYRRGLDPSTGAVQEIDLGGSLPRKPGLLSITQAPVISPDGVTVPASFGGSDRFPVPTAGLFQLAPDAPLGARGSLIAREADPVPGAGRIGIPQNLYYTNDGNLVADVVLPGGGTAALTIRSSASTASRAQTQAAQSAIIPLLATGQPLGESDRTLLSFLGDLVPLGKDQQLVTARYAQAGEIGEGLFAVSRTQRVELLADTMRGAANARFRAFSEPSGVGAGPPSVSPEGNVVFGVYEDRGRKVPQLGVFQWLQSSGTIVRMISLDQEPLSIPADTLAGGVPGRWQAGRGGTAYVLDFGTLFKCSVHPGAPVAEVEPLVVGNPAKMGGMSEFVVDAAGEIFVFGYIPTGYALLRLDPGKRALEPVAMAGDPLPPFADGRKIKGLKFDGFFYLLPDSARGLLLFRADVSWGDGTGSYGLFRRKTDGRLETLLVERLGVAGARDVTIEMSLRPEQQTSDGTTVFGTRDESGRWMIRRRRPVRDAMGRVARDSQGNPVIETTLVAQDGQEWKPGHRFASLNASPLVSPTWALPYGGPIFALNNAGDVAFFASDGQRWGVYEFSDRA